jgi:hypothetical protein
MVVGAASGEKLEPVFAGNSTKVRPDIGCLAVGINPRRSFVEKTQ